MRGNGKSEQEWIDESRFAGRRLAASLQNGAQPPRIDVGLALQGNEFCAGYFPSTLYQWVEGDGSYVKRSGGWMIGGGLFGAAYSAARVGMNVAGNAARRASAARDAAGRWLPVEQATVYLTSRRWCLKTSNTWLDWWFNGIRTSECDGKMITLGLAAVPVTSLAMPVPDYWFVMFQKLAYDRICMPPPPSTEAGLPHAT